MAEQVAQQQTVFQPASPGGMANFDVFDRQASFLSGLASQQYSASQQMIGQVAASFDTALNVYNDYAKQKGAEDAPAAVTRDGNGMLIAPTDFYPPGLHSKAYGEAFKSSYQALYTQTAAQDYQDHSDLMKAKYPADVPAYTAAMTDYRTKMMAGLDPTMAPFIDLRLQQIAGQGATQVGVNLQAQNNTVMAAAANKEIASIVDTASRQDSIKPRDGETDFKGVSERLINDQILGKRYADAEAQLTRAGYGPAYLQNQREEVGFRVAMGTMGRAMRDQVAIDQASGQPDGAIIAGWQRNIYAIAARYPGREDAIIQHLNGQLGAAVSQSSRIAAGIQTQRNNAVDAGNVVRNTQGLIASDPSTPPEVQQIIRDDLRQQALTALTDPSLPPSIKLRVQASASQNMGLAATAYAQSVSNTLLGLHDVAYNPETPPDKLKQTEQEYKNILSAPDLINTLSPEQQHFARQDLAVLASRRLAGNFAAHMIEAMDPNNPLPVASAQKLIADMTANGSMGSGPGAVVPTAQGFALLSAAVTNNAKKDNDISLMAMGSRNAQTHTPQSKEIQDAVSRQQPFRVPGPVGTHFDGSLPEHRQGAQEYFNKWEFLPPEVQSWMGNLPRTSDPAALAPYKDMFDGLMNRTRAMGFTETEGQYAKVQEALGENGNKVVRFFRDAADSGSYELAAKNVQTASNSQTSQQGNPNPVSDTKLDAAIDPYLKKLTGEAEQSGAIAHLKNGQWPFSQSDEEKRANAFFGGYTDKEVERGGNTASYGQAPTTVTVSKDLRAQIASDAANYKALNGSVISRIEADGQNVDAYATRQAFEKNKDLIERTIDPKDPTHAIIGYKSFGSAQAENMGVTRLDAASTTGLTRAIIDQIGGPESWMPHDRSSEQVDPVRTADGNMIWRITAKAGDQYVHLADIPQNDPKLSGLTARITRTASTEADAWFPHRDDATRFGKLFADLTTNRLHDTIREAKIASATQSLGHDPGWEESWVAGVRAVKNLWADKTPLSQQDTESFQKATAAIRQEDQVKAEQIRRFGLLHYFFRPTPDMSLLPAVDPNAPGPAPRIGTKDDHPKPGPTSEQIARRPAPSPTDTFTPQPAANYGAIVGTPPVGPSTQPRPLKPD